MVDVTFCSRSSLPSCFRDVRILFVGKVLLALLQNGIIPTTRLLLLDLRCGLLLVAKIFSKSTTGRVLLLIGPTIVCTSYFLFFLERKQKVSNIVVVAVHTNTIIYYRMLLYLRGFLYSQSSWKLYQYINIVQVPTILVCVSSWFFCFRYIYISSI